MGVTTTTRLLLSYFLFYFFFKWLTVPAHGTSGREKAELSFILGHSDIKTCSAEADGIGVHSKVWLVWKSMNVLLKFDVDQMQYLFFHSFNEISGGFFWGHFFFKTLY